MKFQLANKKIEGIDVDLVAVACTPTSKGKETVATLQSGDGGVQLDQAMHGALSTLIKDEKFAGKIGETLLIPTLGTIPSRYVLIIGSGDKKGYTLDCARRVGSTIAIIAREKKIKTAAAMLQPESINRISSGDRLQGFVEGVIIGNYTFNELKSEKKKNEVLLDTILILNKSSNHARLKKSVTKGEVIGDAINFSRDLVNLPSNYATPRYLAKQGENIAKGSPIKCKVLQEKEIKEENMNLLLAVAQGAVERPVFIHLSYKPKGRAKGRIAIVGKGVTFDTGGVNLKTERHLENMKSDMGGAAAALGAMKAIAALKPNVAVDVYIPSTENVIGSRAIRPNEVFKSRNGKTVEVLNTDAEGRLILADAFDYAQDRKPDVLIDLATLTGGVFYATGTVYTPVLGNDQKLIDKFLTISKQTGELMWQLPLEESYREGFKSDVADINNTGPSGASTITGAIFLCEFVKETTWIHFDIAQSAFKTSSSPVAGCTMKGGTGAGVRSLVEFLLSY